MMRRLLSLDFSERSRYYVLLTELHFRPNELHFRGNRDFTEFCLYNIERKAEQPSDGIRAYVERQIWEKGFDIMLSHTFKTFESDEQFRGEKEDKVK